jgi:hypothetical protein
MQKERLIARQSTSLPWGPRYPLHVIPEPDIALQLQGN